MALFLSADDVICSGRIHCIWGLVEELEEMEELHLHSAHSCRLQVSRMSQTHSRQLCMVLSNVQLSQSSRICRTSQLLDILEEDADLADICCHMVEAHPSAMEASASLDDVDGHGGSRLACIRLESLECHLCM